jgi:hypothetical protein
MRPGTEPDTMTTTDQRDARNAADATLTRECERIRQDQRAGTLTRAEAGRLVEAAHARRDASLR